MSFPKTDTQVQGEEKTLLWVISHDGYCNWGKIKDGATFEGIDPFVFCAEFKLEAAFQINTRIQAQLSDS